MDLNKQQKYKFQKIIYGQHNQKLIQQLDKESAYKLKDILGQKIVNDIAYKKHFPQSQLSRSQYHYQPPNLMSTFCCCFYPQDHKSSFDVTSSLFCKKFYSTFFVWRTDFLTLDHTPEKLQYRNEQNQIIKPQMYGPLWLAITHIIILTITANLNDYFQNIGTQNKFSFKPAYLLKAIIFQLLSHIIQVVLYSTVLSGMKTESATQESVNLIGYSLVLDFLPLALCVVPSDLWHFIWIMIAQAFKTIFICNNLSSKFKADKSGFWLYIIVTIYRFIYGFLLILIFYSNSSGMMIDKGFKQVFHARAFTV